MWLGPVPACSRSGALAGVRGDRQVGRLGRARPAACSLRTVCVRRRRPARGSHSREVPPLPRPGPSGVNQASCMEMAVRPLW